MNLRIVSIYSIVAVWVGIACLVSSNVIAAENKGIVTVNIQEVLLGSSSGQAVKKVLEEKVLEYHKY